MNKVNFQNLYARGAFILTLGSLAGMAQAGDLISHKGAEDCWRTAITKPAFASLMQSSIEGKTGCVAPQSSSSPFPYTVCNTAACPGAQNGCIVTLHASTPSTNFSSGAMSVPGSADTLTVPITYNLGAGNQSCTMTISSIVMSYTLNYTLTDDGNFGKYAASLAQPTASIGSFTTGGNCPPTFSSLASQAAAQAQNVAATAVTAPLNSSTVGQSVCPLVP